MHSLRGPCALQVAFLVGLFGCIAVPCASAQPDSVRRQFEAANEAYSQGRYEAAVTEYRALLDAGSASAALYHNLGNAYVRLDCLGLAVWAYERARKLRPDDPRLQHNLEYVRQRAGLPPIGLPPRGLAALVAGWAPLLLFGGGLLLLTGGLVGAVLRAGTDRIAAWRAPVAWGPVVAGGLLVAAALGTSYLQAQDRRAVVTTESVSLRAAPAPSAAADSTLPGGTMVELQRKQNQWWRVRLGDGTVGWMPVSEVSEV